MKRKKIISLLESLEFGVDGWVNKLSDDHRDKDVVEYQNTNWKSPKISDDTLWAAEADDTSYDPHDETNTEFEDVPDEFGEQFIRIDGGCNGYISENIHNIGIPTLVDAWEYAIDEAFAEFGGLDDHQIEVMIDEKLHHILDEKTYRDLRIDAPNYLRIRDKSKNTPGSRFQTIDESNICYFKTPSHTHPGVVYDQRVKLLALEELIQHYSGVKRPGEIIRMALEGDIEVHCTDPSWKYWGFQYIGTKKHYAIEPEPRYPKIRNPNLKGSVCKHLDNVLFILPFQNGKILQELRKQQRL